MKKERKAKTPEQALASLMNLCSRAEKSSGDARRLMRGWGVAPADAEKVLQKLVDQRFIDDGRYAAAYVREKTNFSAWGANKIRAALAAKGIGREVTDAALAAVAPETTDDRLEKALVRKKKSIRETAAPYEMRAKLMRYALSLGYDYERISDCIERLERNP